MPTDECLGLDDRDDVEDRRKSSIQLDEEPAVAVREPHAAMQLSSQHDQLMSKRCVLCLKSDLLPKWQGQDGQEEIEERDHCVL